MFRGSTPPVPQSGHLDPPSKHGLRPPSHRPLKPDLPPSYSHVALPRSRIVHPRSTQLCPHSTGTLRQPPPIQPASCHALHHSTLIRPARKQSLLYSTGALTLSNSVRYHRNHRSPRFGSAAPQKSSGVSRFSAASQPRSPRLRVNELCINNKPRSEAAASRRPLTVGYGVFFFIADAFGFQNSGSPVTHSCGGRLCDGVKEK